MPRDEAADTAISTIRVPAVDGSFSAAFVAPSSQTNKALIVLQEIFGVTSKIRRYCELFARDGYAALAPDLFWRLEPDVQLSYSEADIQRALGFLKRLDEERALDDVAACVSELRKHGYTQIGIVGFCLGGKLGPLALARGAGNAAVAFYGVGLDQCCNILRTTKQPVQMHFGDQDTHIPPEAVSKMQDLAREKSNFEVFRYPDGGHAFFRPDLKNKESEAAYQRMLTFLKRSLAG